MRRSSKTIEEDDPGEKPSYNRYRKSLGTGGCEQVNTRPVDHVDGVEHCPSDNGRPVDNTNTDNARPVLLMDSRFLQRPSPLLGPL